MCSVFSSYELVGHYLNELKGRLVKNESEEKEKYERERLNST